MNELGYWYKNKGDVKNMLKYYLMSIEHGNSSIMNNLGRWYQMVDDQIMTKKYFLKFVTSINYEKCEEHFLKNKPLQDYLIQVLNDVMVLENIPTDIIRLLLKVDMETYGIRHGGLSLIQKLYREKIDAIEMHFKYSPDGDGMEECKKDFFGRIVRGGI